MDIIGRRRIFYAVSGAFVAASVGALALWGLRLGIDFTGGTLLEVAFPAGRPSVSELERRLSLLGLGPAGSGVRLVPSGERNLLIRTRHLAEAEHAAVLGALGAAEELRFETVGPVIGRELARRSLAAVALVALLIVAYIAFAFRRVSRPVASWKYGLIAVAALLHDVAIPAGLFAAGGRAWGLEADTLFVTAVLTIMGFSVHDTIVVFDRIRENLKRETGGGDFAAVANRSVNETLARSINTSLTVALALAAVWLFGGPSTRIFAATILAGIIVGTYSSICIASPLLVTWHQWQNRPG